MVLKVYVSVLSLIMFLGHRYHKKFYRNINYDLDIWLAVHHSITFLLLPT